MRAIFWRSSYFEDSVDRVLNILQDILTLLLTHHHYSIRILSSFLDTASEGVPTDNVVADEDSLDITSPGSTASLAELAISSFPGAGGGRSVSSFNLYKVQRVVYNEF